MDSNKAIMKKILFLLIFLLNTALVYSQVGIGTTEPKGQLDVNSINMSLVVPRVTSIENVTDGQGNKAVAGSIVYDVSRNKICYRIEGSWICIGVNELGIPEIGTEDPFTSLSNYLKASNTGAGDQFGFSVSLSSDGTRLAVGAQLEDSNATGIDGNQNDNSASNSGAVYVFVRNGDVWSQEAYIKASNAQEGDRFGVSVSISGDGSRLAVGAYLEDSNTTGIDGNQADNSSSFAGAAYIFDRSGSTWSQGAYIKASNTDAGDQFGLSVSLSFDGSRLAVGAHLEDSEATTIDGDENNNNADASGAVYLFNYDGDSEWSQWVYLKSGNSEAGDQFGNSLSLSADGLGLAVGAYLEDSNATDTDGNPWQQIDNSASAAGAVYLFTYSIQLSQWSSSKYIKSSNTEAGDRFGYSVSLSSDGSYLAVGAYFEDSNATGINGDQGDNSTNEASAVYIFDEESNFSQQAYLKASNTGAGDIFGSSVSLSSDGSRLSVGAFQEDSNATGFNSDKTDNSASNAGVVYTYKRVDTLWSQESYIKATNTEANDYFGTSICLAGDGLSLAIGAYFEDSNATGINGDQSNNSAGGSGAVYIVE